MINLLPPQQKEELKQEENLKLVLTMGIIVLAFLICLFLILFLIKTSFLADLEVQELYLIEKEKKLASPEIKQLTEEIRYYNLTLFQLETFYQSQPHLTSTLEKISYTLPPGIYLTSLQFSPDTSQFSLAGFSPSRKMLVQFRENLEKTEAIKEISFPPGTWIPLNDIDFSVTFKIQWP